jgi:hypothetical protein
LTSIERAFHQLSNGIRHFMPSTDRRLELKAKDIDGSDRLTAGCVLIDLVSPAVSRTAVYANGLIAQRVSGDTPPIIGSSKTVTAASGFTYVFGCQPLRWLSYRSGLQPKTYVKPEAAVIVF